MPSQALEISLLFFFPGPSIKKLLRDFGAESTNFQVKPKTAKTPLRNPLPVQTTNPYEVVYDSTAL